MTIEQRLFISLICMITALLLQVERRRMREELHDLLVLYLCGSCAYLRRVRGRKRRFNLPTVNSCPPPPTMAKPRTDES